MSPKLKKGLQYVFFLGLGVFLTFWQYNKMTLEEKASFTKSIKEANYIYLIPVIIMALAAHFSRAFRWRLLMRPIGYNPKIGNTFATVMIGYLVNTLLPRAGEIAKCTMLGKREKIPADKLIGTILVERAIDLGCYVVLILITIALRFNRISGFVVDKYEKSIAESHVHPLLKMGIFIGVILLLIFIFKKLFQKFKSNILFHKINNALLGVKDGFQSIKKLQRKKEFWLHTIFIWLMYLLQIYIGFQAMAFTKELGIDAATAILTMGTLAMILTPGGMGAFPIAVAEVLLLFNLAYEKGYAFGWAIWAASTVIILVGGAISLIWFEANKKGTNELSTIH